MADSEKDVILYLSDEKITETLSEVKKSKFLYEKVNWVENKKGKSLSSLVETVKNEISWLFFYQ
jgi:hypothetical protein